MYGHREGLPLARLLLVGAVNAAFGLVIVGLKVVVH
jgi:hypothetical protein